MPALPALAPAVGVKVAVRVRPEPEMAPRVPPVTTMSPEEPFHAKVAPGSSLKVNVMVAVSPAVRNEALLVIAKVGASVSTASAGVVPAMLSLPASSL